MQVSKFILYNSKKNYPFILFFTSVFYLLFVFASVAAANVATGPLTKGPNLHLLYPNGYSHCFSLFCFHFLLIYVQVRILSYNMRLMLKNHQSPSC